MRVVQEISSSKIQQFQQKILEFYEKEGRHNLSFRQTTNPYHIHISEIMLSQTQVNRVEKYFTTWIETYPTLKDVVNAKNEKLLQHWQGLGYNSRVLHFKEACTQILEKFNGEYPTSKDDLEKLKGVGSYVASAICAFAFNQDIGVVDTNIRRILIYEGFASESMSTKELEETAQQIVPKGKGRDWNNALMDYGALKLTALKSGVKSLGHQSKFVGSSRYIRSFIVKECLHASCCSIEKAKQECLKYYQNYDEIIEKMIVQNIVYIEGDEIRIKN
ncbi:MAG: Fe-S cluster assembly protein HesB [Candidatus Woesearchaeota archaeon]